MNVTQVYIVDEIKQKMHKLAEKLESQKKSNTALSNENSILADKLREQEMEILELKKKNNTLKLSKAFVLENGESQEAKLQINKIVREIDKCIALLNR
jgi:predicted nuclease with TOPRIM domain